MREDWQLTAIDLDRQETAWDEVGREIEQWFLEDGLKELQILYQLVPEYEIDYWRKHGSG